MDGGGGGGSCLAVEKKKEGQQEDGMIERVLAKYTPRGIDPSLVKEICQDVGFRPDSAEAILDQIGVAEGGFAESELEKHQFLARAFPRLQSSEIDALLVKHNGQVELAMDEVLNWNYILNHSHSDDTRSSPGRAKKKGPGKVRVGPENTPFTPSKQSESRNQISALVEELADLLGIEGIVVWSQFHQCKGDIKLVISNLCDEYALSRQVDYDTMKDNIALLTEEYDSLPLTMVIQISWMTGNNLVTCRRVCNILAKDDDNCEDIKHKYMQGFAKAKNNNNTAAAVAAAAAATTRTTTLRVPSATTSRSSSSCSNRSSSRDLMSGSSISRVSSPASPRSTTRANIVQHQKQLDSAVRSLGEAARRARSDPLYGGAIAVYAEEVKRQQTQLTQAHSDMVRNRIDKEFSNRHVVDLHGLTASQATSLVEEYLDMWRRNGGGGEPLTIVTGKGIHSSGGKPVLTPAIDKLLTQGRWKYSKFDGVFVVKGRL